MFGTEGKDGAITPLPQMDDITMDLETLRFLNINKPFITAT